MLSVLRSHSSVNSRTQLVAVGVDLVFRGAQAKQCIQQYVLA